MMAVSLIVLLLTTSCILVAAFHVYNSLGPDQAEEIEKIDRELTEALSIQVPKEK